MSRAYNVMFNATMTQSASISYGTLIGTAAIRPRLFEIEMGSDATPADGAVKFQIQRSTAAGTTPANPQTPTPIDPGDPACLSTFNGSYATSPAFTTLLFQWPQNQRATFRWVCAPGKELVLPAAANAAINLSAPVVAGSAVNYAYTWAFDE